MSIKRELVDSSGNSLATDDLTGSLGVISYEHREVHEGHHFLFAEGITLANGVSQQYLITTPDSTTHAHMIFVMTAGLGATFTLDEGADRTGTTAQTIINSDRNSSETSILTLHKDTSGGTTDGTEIASFAAGSASVGGKVGGGSRAEEEIILKADTKYIFTATSGANANNIAVFMTWYEHSA